MTDTPVTFHVWKYLEYMTDALESTLRAVETFKIKRVGQTAVSDNQSSSVTLNELAKKARKIYCNFEFQQRSHTMTEINPNRAQITKTV